jgi:hypothetical protein
MANAVENNDSFGSKAGAISYSDNAEITFG